MEVTVVTKRENNHSNQLDLFCAGDHAKDQCTQKWRHSNNWKKEYV